MDDSLYISEIILYSGERKREREREKERERESFPFSAYGYDNCHFVEINDLHSVCNVSVIIGNIRL